MAIVIHEFHFNIYNNEGTSGTVAEYATSSPPISGATKYGSYTFGSENLVGVTFTYIQSLKPPPVTCYATLNVSGKDKSDIGSATST